MAANKINNQYKIRKDDRGVTLVELIVVLAILAIMAAAGIFSGVGYVRRSTLEKNDKNAYTIYQAAQTGLQQMDKAGGILTSMTGKIENTYDWIGYILTSANIYTFESSNLSPNMDKYKTYFSGLYSNADEFTDFNAAAAKKNESVHMRYVLYYSPNNPNTTQSKLVKDLIQPYFNDANVFSGSMIIELDVEKAADAYGKEHRTAKCLSVFYDSRVRNGWSEIQLRSDSSRSKTLIGYYDGYLGSAVDTVYLPQLQEGIAVKKFAAEYKLVSEEEGEGDSAVTKYSIQTWICWSATLDTVNMLGADKDVYYRMAFSKEGNVKYILILNDDFMKYGQVIGQKNVDNFLSLETMSKGETLNGYTIQEETNTVVYSDSVSKEVTKKFIAFDAQVYYIIGDNDNYRNSEKSTISAKLIKMPMRISYVTGELDSDLNPKDPYFEYSLDISRATYSSDDPVDLVSDVDKSVLTIHPNYFTKDSMSSANDENGIIAYKKGKSTDIEKVETPTPEPPPP